MTALDDLRSALAASERGGGAGVPYLGVFAAVLHIPSVRADIRSLVQQLEDEELERYAAACDREGV